MNDLRKSTSSKPLMLNFVKSQKMEIVKEEDIAMKYDPILQVTYFMGGGSSKGSKSQTETKQTLNGMTGRTKHYKEDHVYGSDD